MNARTGYLSGVAVVLVVAVGAAQPKPNFSGTWKKVEPQKQSSAVHVERIELRGAVLKTTFDGSDPGTPLGATYHYSRSYTIGAPEQTMQDKDGRVRGVTVTWDGPSLLIITTARAGAYITTQREVWSLSEDGTRLTKSRVDTSPQGTVSTRTVYERQ